MSDSTREVFQSDALNEFRCSYIKAVTKESKDLIWSNTLAPFIEKIPGDEKNNLVTFLYRQSASESTADFSVYLHCDAIGLPFSEKNRFKLILETDIFYLTLILPSTLRTAYSILKLDNIVKIPVKEDSGYLLDPYPEFSGKLKEIHAMVMKLHEEKKVDIDSRNPKRISYLDYDNPDKCFFTESVLELPMAPIQPNYLSDVNLIRNERNTLMQEKRFFQYSLQFSPTSLKDLSDQPLRGARKYWIYLPPGFKESNKLNYPLFLFLDGSDYLNTLPIPSILERMINQKDIPPCCAIFFEYSPDRRELEYYGDERFTHFLANDLMDMIREKHLLPIATDPKLKTIVGLSASGLAAIYAGLTRPDVFGNVITQSAALWSRKRNDLEKWVDDYVLKKADTFFCMEAGSYENVPAECQFKDGFTQAFSILEANTELTAYMNKKGVNAIFHEFIGGHNYVCYRGSIADRIKEVIKIRCRGT